MASGLQTYIGFEFDDDNFEMRNWMYTSQKKPFPEERNRKGTDWMKRRSEKYPIQATNASPVRNPKIAPRSSTRLFVFVFVFGLLLFCFFIVPFSLFCCWYPYCFAVDTRLARTPKVKSPKRGPPTTPKIVSEAWIKKTTLCIVSTALHRCSPCHLSGPLQCHCHQCIITVVVVTP